MLTSYISVYLNGHPFNCFPGLSLKDFLDYFAFDLNSIVVEHNNKIVQSVALTSIVIMPEDKIEVLTIVGGG